MISFGLRCNVFIYAETVLSRWTT